MSGKRKYVFSEALTAELRAAYNGNKAHLSMALDHLEAHTKWPRHAFETEATRLGIQCVFRPWTAAEEAYLSEWAGVKSRKAIARTLGRSVRSVRWRERELDLSQRGKEGYSLSDLAAVLGVSNSKISGWVRRGLVVPSPASLRVMEEAVERFLRKYPDLYDLRRVDQVWFKSMIFGRVVTHGKGGRVSAEVVSRGACGGEETGL